MAKEEYILENGEFRLALDRQGNLFQLESPLAPKGGIFRAGEAEKPCFSWFLDVDGIELPRENMIFEPPIIAGHAAKYVGYHKQLTIEVSVVLDHLGPCWQMSITAHGPGRVTGAGFTLLESLSFWPKLRCTFPYCAGWALPMADIAAGEEFTLNYPVNASMQWTSLYTRDRGVYFGVHDHIPLYKELSFGHSFARWKFLDLDLNPDERLELPPVYLIPHRGDWRAGAGYYRAWAQHHVKTPDTPDWYAQKPAWAWVGLKGQHLETIWHDTTYLSEISAFVAQTGVELIQLTAYTEQGHDTLYPDYVPGNIVGGVTGLRRAVDGIHQAGRRISIYTNGRVIDPASTVSPEDRQAWGVRAAPGADVFREQYGDVVFDVMCPGASGWRSLFIEKLEYLVEEFDIDGIYIDQVSGCRSLPCYASNHDHAKPNLAWSCYRQFIMELRERLTSIKPGIFLSTEGVNDLLGQYFDSQQAHNDWVTLTRDRGIQLPDLFRMTFPGQLLNVGCITHGQSGPYYLKLAHASGGGCDFGVWDWVEMPDSFLEKARVIVEWYAKHADTFRSGRIVPLVDEETRSMWKANAFYGSSKIVVNGGWLSDTQETTSCSIRVPIPPGRRVRNVQVLKGNGSVPGDWFLSDGEMDIHLHGGGQIAGVAIDLEERAD